MTSRIYFQSGFWKSLSSNATREGIRAMLHISEALCDSLVITDVTEDLIKQDPFLMVLIRQGKYLRCDENYIEKKLYRLKNEDNFIEKSEDLCATYLLNNRQSECNHFKGAYGVVVINAESPSNIDVYFKGDGLFLDKNHMYSQRYMTFKDKLSQPCNSLIIIDPYILLKRQVDKTKSVTYPGIQNNLESLLDAILPQKLDVEFHLTIISSLENGKEDVKRAYEKIKKCLKKIRKELNIKFGFFYTGKGYRFDVESFHSRHILSNSFIIDSEDGFDLFGDKGYITKNNPTISIVFPRLLGNNRQDMTKYENWIRSVKKHVEESSESLFCGTKENRLFDLIS